MTDQQPPVDKSYRWWKDLEYVPISADICAIEEDGEYFILVLRHEHENESYPISKWTYGNLRLDMMRLRADKLGKQTDAMLAELHELNEAIDHILTGGDANETQE